NTEAGSKALHVVGVATERPYGGVPVRVRRPFDGASIGDYFGPLQPWSRRLCLPPARLRKAITACWPGSTRLDLVCSGGRDAHRFLVAGLEAEEGCAKPVTNPHQRDDRGRTCRLQSQLAGIPADRGGSRDPRGSKRSSVQSGSVGVA